MADVGWNCARFAMETAGGTCRERVEIHGRMYFLLRHSRALREMLLGITPIRIQNSDFHMDIRRMEARRKARSRFLF